MECCYPRGDIAVTQLQKLLGSICKTALLRARKYKRAFFGAQNCLLGSSLLENKIGQFFFRGLLKKELRRLELNPRHECCARSVNRCNDRYVLGLPLHRTRDLLIVTTLTLSDLNQFMRGFWCGPLAIDVLIRRLLTAMTFLLLAK